MRGRPRPAAFTSVRVRVTSVAGRRGLALLAAAPPNVTADSAQTAAAATGLARDPVRPVTLPLPPALAPPWLRTRHLVLAVRLAKARLLPVPASATGRAAPVSTPRPPHHAAQRLAMATTTKLWEDATAVVPARCLMCRPAPLDVSRLPVVRGHATQATFSAVRAEFLSCAVQRVPGRTRLHAHQRNTAQVAAARLRSGMVTLAKAAVSVRAAIVPTPPAVPLARRDVAARASIFPPATRTAGAAGGRAGRDRPVPAETVISTTANLARRAVSA